MWASPGIESPRARRPASGSDWCANPAALSPLHRPELRSAASAARLDWLPSRPRANRRHILVHPRTDGHAEFLLQVGIVILGNAITRKIPEKRVAEILMELWNVHEQAIGLLDDADRDVLQTQCVVASNRIEQFFVRIDRVRRHFF